jgi:proteasome lid subunit RPN8/RPN11
MIAQAFAELPNECVGLLAAKPENRGDSIRVERRYPLVNALAGPVEYLAGWLVPGGLRAQLVNGLASQVEYLSSDTSLLAAHVDMRESGLDMVGVYHSHPTTEPVPSRKDLGRNFYGLYVVHFIISLKEQTPVVRGWWLMETDYREAEWEVVDDD